MGAFRIRILIVDDHPVVLEGLRVLVGSQNDMTVIGEAVTGGEALLLSKQLVPDLTLLNLRLPDVPAAQVITALRTEQPDARVIVLSSGEGDTDLVPALEAGARGHVVKDAPRDEFVAAIRCVAKGIPFGARHAPGRLDDMTTMTRMTETEEVIIQLVAEGLSDEEIAELVPATIESVRTQIKGIVRKIESRGRIAALSEPLARGLMRSH